MVAGGADVVVPDLVHDNLVCLLERLWLEAWDAASGVVSGGFGGEDCLDLAGDVVE